MLGSKRKERGVQEALKPEVLADIDRLNIIRARFLPNPKIALFDENMYLIGHALPAEKYPDRYEFHPWQPVTIAFYCIDFGQPMSVPEFHRGQWRLKAGETLIVTKGAP